MHGCIAVDVHLEASDCICTITNWEEPGDEATHKVSTVTLAHAPSINDMAALLHAAASVHGINQITSVDCIYPDLYIIKS